MAEESQPLSEWVLETFPAYAETLLKIQTMEGELVNFEFNEVQTLLESIIDDIRRSGRLVRNIYLKARREGVSTWATARGYWRTVNAFNRYAVIVAHEPDSTDFIFKMVKRYQDNMVPQFKPSERYNNRKILELNNESGTGLDSAIRVGTAGKDDFGSGQLIHFLHLSELAKWPAATIKPLLTSMMQCVPKNTLSEVHIESTAKGIGGEFYNRFWNARYRYEIYTEPDGTPTYRMTVNEKASKANEWNAIFIPWFVFRKYEADPEPDFEPDDEEKELVGLYGLTHAKLAWRRWCIENNCDGDKEIFKQEYPSNPHEAFIASGDNVFDVKKILLLKKHAPKPTRRYECTLSTGVWVASDTGRFRVWKEPVPGRKYIVAADVAEGLPGGDFDSADVIDWLTGEQCAQWHGHIDPDLFGVVLYHIGKRYNNALLVPERNNHGLMVVKKLQELHYKRIWVETIHEPPHRPRPRFGWVTGTSKGKGKFAMIDNLVGHIREGTHGIKCEDTFGEMLTFVTTEDGKVQAEEGQNDDRVMSIAIAHMVRKMRPLPHMMQVMKDDAPTSFFGKSSAAQAPRVAPRSATINKAWG